MFFYQRSLRLVMILTIAVLTLTWARPVEGAGLAAQAAALNPAPPSHTIKLVFIHHSTGENWLRDDYGGLGQALSANNYYVSDTNYGCIRVLKSRAMSTRLWGLEPRRESRTGPAPRRPPTKEIPERSAKQQVAITRRR